MVCPFIYVNCLFYMPVSVTMSIYLCASGEIPMSMEECVYINLCLYPHIHLYLFISIHLQARRCRCRWGSTPSPLTPPATPPVELTWPPSCFPASSLPSTTARWSPSPPPRKCEERIAREIGMQERLGRVG